MRKEFVEKNLSVSIWKKESIHIHKFEKMLYYVLVLVDDV